MGCGQVAAGSSKEMQGDAQSLEVLPMGEHVDEEIVEGEELEAEAEIESLKALPTPSMPNQEVVEEHRLDHIHYRPWCDECVEGRGKERGHATAEQRSRTIPIVSFDYFFISKAGVFSRSEWGLQEDQIGQKVLLVRETPGNGGRSSVFAHCVPQKGSDEMRPGSRQIALLETYNGLVPLR